MNNTVTFEGLKDFRLLGVMEGEKKEYDDTEVVYLYIGYADDYTCYKVWSENVDYCSFTDWNIERCEPPVRDARYKAIGERIVSIKRIDEDDERVWGISVTTYTKTLKFENTNYDCCYVDVIWDLL
jgi:hypothetical protein